MNIWKHFKTITHHKFMVMKGCFEVGLYWQGLLHDLSKYMPSEFLVGAKYYQGTQSPNNAERKDKGYSSAWLHHKGRNKHHYEYWMDYSSRMAGIVPAKMPDRYVVEMFIDRIAASKNYNRENYTDDMPLKYYYMGGNPEKFMHKDTQRKLEFLLKMLAREGEKRTMRYIRRCIIPRIRNKNNLPV